MRGYVPTPDNLVDQMVDLLFRDNPPSAISKILDPGCGPGAFISGIIRWCKRHCQPIPMITGIELDPNRADEARQIFEDVPEVSIQQSDFLSTCDNPIYDYVVANPPYVSILNLDSEEKERYRSEYRSARGRFDLYMLFMEKAIRQCISEAILVFVTPEKYTYVNSGSGIRRILTKHHVTDLLMVKEGIFNSVIAYPAISRIAIDSSGETRFSPRNGQTRLVNLPKGVESWRDSFSSHTTTLERYHTEFTLKDFCTRISCGVATGADSLFVFPREELPTRFRPFAWPTIAGRQLKPDSNSIPSESVMLVPYDRSAQLLNIEELGAFGEYLLSPKTCNRLRKRSCTERKPWYAFHDNPPMKDLVQPKIICKDICALPHFWVDDSGSVIPRHSVYYIIPDTPTLLKPITDFLNSSRVKEWIVQNAQRASNGYLRVQSSMLKRLPIPDEIAGQWYGIKQSEAQSLPLFAGSTMPVRSRRC